MDSVTKKALQGSIEKWEKVVSGEISAREATNSINCPLCRLFSKGLALCISCPVWEDTCLSECKGTPFVEFSRAWLDGSTNLTKLAQAELDYLKNLYKKLCPEDFPNASA